MKIYLSILGFCLLFIFNSCLSVKNLNRGEILQDFNDVGDKKYSLYLYTSQGCGFCLASMRFLKQNDICNNPNISLVIIENYLQDFKDKKEFRFDMDYYPECSKIILADKISGRIYRLHSE